MSADWNNLLSSSANNPGSKSNDMVLDSLSMNFAPNEGHDTTVQPFSNPYGFGQTAQFDSGTRNFGTGVNVSNFTSVQGSFVQHLSARFPAETTRKEMLIFVERARTSPLLNLQVDHEMASLHEMNRYLLTPEGRQKYGGLKSCEKLLNDFGFGGSYNASIPQYAMGGLHQQYDAALVVGRRARIAAVTRAHVTYGDNLTDRSLHSVHLLCIRRKVMSHDIERTKDKTGNRYGMREEDLYYWNFCMHVGPRNSTPAAYLYIDDESTGQAIRVGKLLQNNGSNKSNKVMTDRAQNSINGPLNALQDDRAYLRSTPLLPYVDVMINM